MDRMKKEKQTCVVFDEDNALLKKKMEEDLKQTIELLKNSDAYVVFAHTTEHTVATSFFTPQTAKLFIMAIIEWIKCTREAIMGGKKDE